MTEPDDKEAGATAPASPFPRRDVPPITSFRIWPNRSLPLSGRRHVLIFTAVMLTLPLIPQLGTPVGWALMPFLAGALGLLWFFLRRSTRDRLAQWEEVCIWADLITVERHDPDRPPRYWHANPYWVEVAVTKDATPENYLTLRGNDREIELGAFLSPDERLALRDDLARALGKARAATGAP